MMMIMVCVCGKSPFPLESKCIHRKPIMLSMNERETWKGEKKGEMRERKNRKKTK